MNPLRTVKAARSFGDRVKRFAGRKERGRWLRAMCPDREQEAVRILEEALRGGRVNPPHAFAVFYLCEGKANTLSCIGRSFRKEDGTVPSILVAEIGVDVERVLDLTEPRIRASLEVTSEELLDPLDMSVSQSIGAAAFRAGFDGLVYPRPLGSGFRNLALFLDRVRPESLQVITAVELNAAGVL